MDYYFGSEAETSEAVRNGWYYTDDLGVVDGDGYLAITGRADDVIRSGGELVSPIEVEETLEEHGAVEAAVVVGRGTAEELDRHCREAAGLAEFKRPRE